MSFSEPEAARIPGHELEMEVAELKGEGSGLHQTKCKKKCQKKHKHRNKHKNKNKNRTRVLERPYIITIETTTGSISARLPVSLSTNLSTTSGSITVTIFPLRLGQSQSATDNNNISLVTSTDTGSQHIRLTEPISLGRSESEPWSEPESSPAVDRNSPVPGSQKASASHSSGQGNMHIAYPAQWAGSVHGESVAGDVLLSGRGLAVTEGGDGSVDGIKLDREGEDWWGAHMDVSLEAWREGTIFFYVG